jgi:3-oxoacyl-[acyl-carrier-protein] synthase-3
LLDDLGWDRDSVDGLIMVTQCPDYVCPATACVILGKLGLSVSTFAYDVNLGCSSYVYGLWIASQAIASGTAKRVLLLAGDTLSPVFSPEDKSCHDAVWRCRDRDGTGI